MENISSVAMALAMVAAFLLLIGGIKLAADRQTRAKGVLMIVAALVLVTNVMIACASSSVRKNLGIFSLSYDFATPTFISSNDGRAPFPFSFVNV